MAIRIREINGSLVALCAAETTKEPKDIYLNDNIHHALSTKFAVDFNSMYPEYDIPFEKRLAELTVKEQV